MKRLLAAFLLFAVPVTIYAAEPLSRRDGFLMIWQSIRRPAEPAKTRFSDVPEPARGSLEIDYAAERKIIDAGDAFHPDDPLRLEQALIWLFRSRNIVDDPEEVNAETLSELLLRYPVAHVPAVAQSPEISEEELTELIRLLDMQLMTEDHEVSLYAEKFHGKGTAFGETFDMHSYTAAHRSFPHNTLVKVTNPSNGKSVVVRINDRGPYVSGRDMDLSLAAFTAIESRSKGKFRAIFQRLGDVSIVGECGGGDAMQQRLSRDVFLTDGVPHVFKLGGTMTLQSDSRFVVRGVRYPDGTPNAMQDFILEGETFTFKPSVAGEYVFRVGTIDGRIRTMTMNVQNCAGE